MYDRECSHHVRDPSLELAKEIYEVAVINERLPLISQTKQS